jgi:hypothetical protein
MSHREQLRMAMHILFLPMRRQDAVRAAKRVGVRNTPVYPTTKSMKVTLGAGNLVGLIVTESRAAPEVATTNEIALVDIATTHIRLVRSTLRERAGLRNSRVSKKADAL